MNPIRPTDDAGYLEAAARIIFMGGLNRQVVDNKWPGFRAAFHGFAVDRVAAMTASDVARLTEDDRVIKYRAKLQAVVNNAGTMAALARTHGSFGRYVEQLFAQQAPDGTARELARQFNYISVDGARNWLYSTGFDVGPVDETNARKYAPYVG
jgi:3-methyladenine DNA glycosylase Tag